MHAVLITFEFSAHDALDQKVFQDHQRLIDRSPGVVMSTVLQDGSHYGFFHVFSDARLADDYLACREIDAFTQRPSCSDFYVHRFNIVDGFSLPDDRIEHLISETVAPAPIS